MKAGIITFHRAYNYGAALQAYALRTALCKIGFEAEVIDYGKIGQTKRFDFPTNGIKPFVAAMILNVLSLTNADIRRYRFRKFLKNQMGVSDERYTDHNQLTDIENKYDLFITGSDQVWNPFLTDNDTTYLLDFVKDSEKKISYAASYGLKQIPNEFEQVFKMNLSDFKSISVREQAGQVITKELTGHDSTIVLDPTFLLDADEWDKIAITPRLKSPYILCFSIMNDPEGLISFCKYLSKMTGYQIVRIANPYLKIENGIKTIATAGPREFLGLIKNASIVITNSFHGTAFSIIYQKPFFTFLYNNDRDIRLKEITNKLGLTHRLIGEKNKMITKYDISIDYSVVNNKLKNEQDSSLNYLSQAITQN
jgi:hypothetical protein